MSGRAARASKARKRWYRSDLKGWKWLGEHTAFRLPSVMGSITWEDRITVLPATVPVSPKEREVGA